MNSNSYMNNNSILELLRASTFANEMTAMADRTKNHAKTKQERLWAKLMRSCATMMDRVVAERLKLVGDDQLPSVLRRLAHTEIRMYTTDQLRAEDTMDNVPFEKVTLSNVDAFLLAELCLIACYSCPQGDCVKGCEYRAVMHRMGVPVGREIVGPGQCEFRMDDVMRVVLPQGHKDQAQLLADKLEAVVAQVKLDRRNLNEVVL